MKTIQVFDPPMCCSSGVCGTTIDQDVVGLSTMLARLARHGVAVERHNLAQEPMAFAQSEPVKTLLEREGDGALPIIIIDGLVRVQGRYPTAEERSTFLRTALTSEVEAVGPASK